MGDGRCRWNSLLTRTATLTGTVALPNLGRIAVNPSRGPSHSPCHSLSLIPGRESGCHRIESWERHHMTMYWTPLVYVFIGLCSATPLWCKKLCNTH